MLKQDLPDEGDWALTVRYCNGLMRKIFPFVVCDAIRVFSQTKQGGISHGSGKAAPKGCPSIYQKTKPRARLCSSSEMHPIVVVTFS